MHYVSGKVEPSKIGSWNAIVGNEDYTLCGATTKQVQATPTYQDVICLECRILLDQKGLWTFYGEEIEELERLWAKT